MFLSNLNVEFDNLQTCGIYSQVPKIVMNTTSEVPSKIPHEVQYIALHCLHTYHTLVSTAMFSRSYTQWNKITSSAVLTVAGTGK